MYYFKISNHPNIPSIQRIMEDTTSNNRVATSDPNGEIKYEFIVKHYACNVSIDPVTNLPIIEDETKYIKELDKNIDLKAVKGRTFPTLINGEVVQIDQYEAIRGMGLQMKYIDMLTLFVNSNDVVVYNGDGSNVINVKCNY